MTGERKTAALDEAVLDARLMALEGARSWSPRVVSRLEARIRTADDFDLFRINPVAYATSQGLAEGEAIDLFLHATKAGLFDMEWNVVCAGCGNTNTSFRRLESVDPHTTCDLCQFESTAALDDFIQVTFTISPAVRRIAYHDPASLSAEDLYFRYHFCRDVRPGSDGTTMAQKFASITRTLAYLEPGETATAALQLSGSMVGIRDALHSASAMYGIVPPESAPRDLNLAVRDGRLADLDQSLQPLEVGAANGRWMFPATGRVAAGSVTATVENTMSERASVWIIEYPARATPEPIEFYPILSAKRLLSTQTFRTLFRSETVAASEGLEIRDLTFLFTDLQDSTAMYDRIGDGTAYNLVRQHFDALEVTVRDQAGAIVKTIGDAVMATFVRPADGVRAALAMFDRLEAFNRSTSANLVLKVGLHRGHAIAVTSNEQVDYFGQTVNIAARVQGLAGPGEVCLSEDVLRDPDVQRALAGRDVERAPGLMKGVAAEIPVYRVTVRAPAGDAIVAR